METSLLKLLEMEERSVFSINSLSGQVKFFAEKVEFVKTLPECASRDADIGVYAKLSEDAETAIYEERKTLCSIRSEIAAHLKLIMEV